jgi:hypothetical protein
MAMRRIHYQNIMSKDQFLRTFCDHIDIFGSESDRSYMQNKAISVCGRSIISFDKLWYTLLIGVVYIYDNEKYN